MNFGRKNRAFTLVELLVVIAIIGILSAVVLASIQDARKKAGNAAINQSILQYLNAIETYNTATGSYPIPSGTVTDEYCLGDYKNIGTVDLNACGQWNTSPPPARYANHENSTLAAALGQYMSGLPKVNNTDIVWQTYKRLGATYQCQDISCNKIWIKWWLNGTNIQCALGATQISDTLGTQCVYSSK